MALSCFTGFYLFLLFFRGFCLVFELSGSFTGFYRVFFWLFIRFYLEFPLLDKQVLLSFRFFSICFA